MSWLLIVFMSVYPNGGGAKAVAMHEFRDQAECVEAGEWIKGQEHDRIKYKCQQVGRIGRP